MKLEKIGKNQSTKFTIADKLTVIDSELLR